MSEFTLFGFGILTLTPRHSHNPYLCNHRRRRSDSGAGVMILCGMKPSKQTGECGEVLVESARIGGAAKDFLCDIFLDYRMRKRVQICHRDCISSKSVVVVVVQCRLCCLEHALGTANTLVLEVCTMTTYDLGLIRAVKAATFVETRVYIRQFSGRGGRFR